MQERRQVPELLSGAAEKHWPCHLQIASSNPDNARTWCLRAKLTVDEV